MSLPQTIIGTTDRIDLPEYALYNLPSKVDTGAGTSSIHSHCIRIMERDGMQWLEFRLLNSSHDAYHQKPYATRYFEERLVRSSSGHANYRCVITTQVLIFGQLHEIQFTLADRGQMKFPVLLGKSLLNQRFLVDVSQRDLSYRQKTSRHNGAASASAPQTEKLSCPES